MDNTFQVLAELKKQQREPPFKAPQMDAPVQYTVLAEIPATNPADAHSTKKFGLHQPRADLIFRWQNGVPIAPVNPRLSQVVRSTPLGVPCSELQ